MKSFFKDITLKDFGTSIFFIVVLPGLVIYLTWYVADQQKLTALESSLLQVISIMASVASSYYFSKKAARNMVEERAKLALRRIFTVYTFFPRIIQSIEDQKTFLNTVSESQQGLTKSHVDQSLDLLKVQSYEQLGAMNDAVDDWKDLVPKPEEVLNKYQESEHE